MPTLLNDLIEEWKKVPEYSDVEAENWEPGQRGHKGDTKGT